MIHLLVAIGTLILALIATMTAFGIHYNRTMRCYAAMWGDISPYEDDVEVGWYVRLLKPVTQRDFFQSSGKMLSALRNGDTTGIVTLTPIPLDQHLRAARELSESQAETIAHLLQFRTSLAGDYCKMLMMVMTLSVLMIMGFFVVTAIYPPPSFR